MLTKSLSYVFPVINPNLYVKVTGVQLFMWKCDLMWSEKEDDDLDEHKEEEEEEEEEEREKEEEKEEDGKGEEEERKGEEVSKVEILEYQKVELRLFFSHHPKTSFHSQPFLV